MTISRRFLHVGLLVTSAGLWGSDARAQVPRFEDQVTVHKAHRSRGTDLVLTFSGPVAIPGVSLARGTYVFRQIRADTIQVLSGDRKAAYAMVLTRPTMGGDAAEGYPFVFGAPLAAGAPRTIKAWYQPGRAIGQESIYPARHIPDAREVALGSK